MTPSTKDLIEEHSGIMMMLKVMERMAEKLERSEAVETNHLVKLVEFLQNFTDKCHHGKEERYLFPELLKNPANQAIINELWGEHKTGHDFIRGIAESLGGYAPGNPDAVHMAVNMRGYVQLITEHIRKENEHLFLVADQQLPPEFSLSIQAEYDQFEADVLGAGKHEEYQQWLAELESTYLMN